MSSNADLRPTSARLVLVVAALVVSVVSTLGASLIPTISHDQHVSLASAQWVLTVTLLVGAVATPVLGRIGDGPLRRQTLVATLGVVCLGSAVAALSGDRFWQLLIGRGLQGVGYATVPLTIAIAREVLAGDAARKTIAVLSVTVAVGAGLGYPVTGLIAQQLDFHDAYWMATVLSVVAAWGIMKIIPRAPRAPAAVVAADAQPRHFDVTGALLLGAGLAAGLLAVSQGEEWGWTSGRIVGLALATVVLLAAWVRVELRVADPLVDLRLMSARAVMGANASAVLIGFGMYMIMSLISRLAQTPASTGYGLGASLVSTGLLLVPLSIASLVSAPIARAIGRRFGMRVVLPLGALVVAAAGLQLAAAHGHMADLAIATALSGIGIGCSFAAMPALIVASVPNERTGSATSLNQVLRTVGGAVGSAVSAAILTAHTASGSVLPQASGYDVAFVLGGVVCALTAIVAWVLVPARAVPRDELDDPEVALLMEEEATSAMGPSVFDGERSVRVPA
jgi:MFS family permease